MQIDINRDKSSYLSTLTARINGPGDVAGPSVVKRMNDVRFLSKFSVALL